ncbi:unnamed protein product [Orchesella dallaii]|uniref:F-box domain-containing protein n=1 Tax=Orchesella dallaii TaxID=48710 RepID=A0ABP1RU38_9HEXA
MEIQVKSKEVETETPHILRVFPELWPNILQHLSPTEFHSLINSSPVLRAQHESEKTTRLLSLVLEILLNQPISSLDLKTWLNLRQVSKAAKNQVDKLLSDESGPDAYWNSVTTRYFEWSKYCGDERQNFRRICKRVRADTTMDFRFRDHKFFNLVINPNPSIWGGGGDFDPHNENETKDHPFLAKYLNIDCVHVTDSRFPPEEMVIESLLSFISQYGHNVTHMRCNNSFEIGIVFKLLPHLPNLKVLKLHSTSDVLNQPEYVNQLHYPQLRNLEFLDLDGFYDQTRNRVSTRMNTAFVREYGPQLKTLSCGGQFFKGWWGLGGFYKKKLCNLQRLRVSKVTEQVFVALSETKFAALQELHLNNYGVEYPKRGFTLQQVVNVLNQFAQSLTSVHLYLDLGHVSSINDQVTEASLKVPFPQMKKFSTLLKNVDEDWFWPFIKHKCQNIQELSLQYSDVRRRIDKAKHIKLQDAFGLVPNLRRVRISYLFLCQSVPFRVDIFRDKIEYQKLWC